MGDGVGGEVGQVAQAEGPERILLGAVVHLVADLPEVRVPARGDVMLGDRRIRGDGPVEKVVGKGMQQVGGDRGEQPEVGEDRFPEVNVRSRGPRPDRSKAGP